MSCTELFGAVVGEGDVGEAREAPHGVVPALGAGLDLGARASTSTSGICAPAGTFISERTERISEMRSTTQPISASAAGVDQAVELAASGASARIVSRFGPPSPLIAHSSSVMKGMKGCSSLQISSSTQAIVARVSALAGVVRALQHRLGQLEVPVAEHVPDEVVERAAPPR